MIKVHSLWRFICSDSFHVFCSRAEDTKLALGLSSTF